MPQNPLVPRRGGNNSIKNITAATVIKGTPGTIFTVSVNVAGTAAGKVSDAATVATVAAANLVSTIPSTVGDIKLEWPCAVGIVVTPGAGQTLSVSFS